MSKEKNQATTAAEASPAPEAGKKKDSEKKAPTLMEQYQDAKSKALTDDEKETKLTKAWDNSIEKIIINTYPGIEKITKHLDSFREDIIKHAMLQEDTDQALLKVAQAHAEGIKEMSSEEFIKYFDVSIEQLNKVAPGLRKLRRSTILREGAARLDGENNLQDNVDDVVAVEAAIAKTEGLEGKAVFVSNQIDSVKEQKLRREVSRAKKELAMAEETYYQGGGISEEMAEVVKELKAEVSQELEGYQQLLKEEGLKLEREIHNLENEYRLLDELLYTGQGEEADMAGTIEAMEEQEQIMANKKQELERLAERRRDIGTELAELTTEITADAESVTTAVEENKDLELYGSLAATIPSLTKEQAAEMIAVLREQYKDDKDKIEQLDKVEADIEAGLIPTSDTVTYDSGALPTETAPVEISGQILEIAAYNADLARRIAELPVSEEAKQQFAQEYNRNYEDHQAYSTKKGFFKKLGKVNRADAISAKEQLDMLDEVLGRIPNSSNPEKLVQDIFSGAYAMGESDVTYDLPEFEAGVSPPESTTAVEGGVSTEAPAEVFVDESDEETNPSDDLEEVVDTEEPQDRSAELEPSTSEEEFFQESILNDLEEVNPTIAAKMQNMGIGAAIQNKVAKYYLEANDTYHDNKEKLGFFASRFGNSVERQMMKMAKATMAAIENSLEAIAGLSNPDAVDNTLNQIVDREMGEGAVVSEGGDDGEPPERGYERHEAQGFLEKLRKSKMTKPIVLALALAGQLSLFTVARKAEAAQATPPTGSATALEMTSAEFQDILDGKEPANFDYNVFTKTIKGEDVIVIEVDPPANTLVEGYRYFELPGEDMIYQADSFMQWGGRHGEKGAEFAYHPHMEEEVLVEQAEDMAEAALAPMLVAHIEPNDAIEEIEGHCIGTASAEGPADINQELSEERGEKAALTLADTFDAKGIDSGKIVITSEGAGAEGDLIEFDQALQKEGVMIGGKTKQEREANLYEMIRKIHDGEETRPEVIAAFMDNVEPHRRVDMVLKVKMHDIIVKIPEEKKDAPPPIIQVLQDEGLLPDQPFLPPPGFEDLPEQSAMNPAIEATIKEAPFIQTVKFGKGVSGQGTSSIARAFHQRGQNIRGFGKGGPGTKRSPSSKPRSRRGSRK